MAKNTRLKRLKQELDQIENDLAMMSSDVDARTVAEMLRLLVMTLQDHAKELLDNADSSSKP